MNALATRTICGTKPLIILQRIAGSERGEVPDCGGRGNIVWLVKQVALVGEADFARLHKATGGLLFALLLRVLPDSRAAEETLKSVFAEFRREAVRFGAKREHSLTWLIGVADRYDIERLPLDDQFESFKTNGARVNGKTAGIDKLFTRFRLSQNRLESEKARLFIKKFFNKRGNE